MCVEVMNYLSRVCVLLPRAVKARILAHAINAAFKLGAASVELACPWWLVVFVTERRASTRLDATRPSSPSRTQQGTSAKFYAGKQLHPAPSG